MMSNVPQLVPTYPMGAVPRFMPPMMGVPPPMNGQMMMPQPGMVPGMVPGMPMGFFPPMPQGPPIPPSTTQKPNMRNMNVPFAGAIDDANATSMNEDDRMDIEMDEDTTTKPNSLMSPSMFNRPPPQLFGGVPVAVVGGGDNADFANKNDAMNFNNNSGAGMDDRSGSREPIGNDRDREMRSRGRDRGAGNRDNRRNEFGNDKNSRWPNSRGRSNEDEAGGKRPDSRERNDSRSRDRSDRDKTLHDRLRDLAGDGNNRGGDFNNARNNMPWRDGMPHPMNYGGGGNNFGDRRQINMGGMPPALEDIRIPMPLENLRGPALAMGNKNQHGRGFGNSVYFSTSFCLPRPPL